MITLGISTSLSQFTLIFGKDNKVIFNSEWIELKDKKEISLLFNEGLKYTNKSISDIKNILVDIGPGGTSSVRTGVAFANSLAYSLKIPVVPVSSLEIAGINIWEDKKIPVINTVKSIKNNAFIGFFQGYNKFSIKYGLIDDILPSLIRDIDKFAIVGYHREIIKEITKNKEIVDTGLLFGNAEILIKKQEMFLERALIYPKISFPITEQNIH